MERSLWDSTSEIGVLAKLGLQMFHTERVEGFFSLSCFYTQN